MSNLKELLKSIKVQQAEQNESYVSYDKKDHKIYKITNRRPLETEYEVVAVSTDTVKPILEGSKSVSDFTVVYDFASKQVVVKELNYEDHYNSAGSFIHEFTRTSVSKDSHTNFDKIYDGAIIDIWIKQDSYQKNQLVYYQGNIYKLLETNKENEDFNFNCASLFVEDVKLTTASTTDHTVSLEVNKPIFEGVHVDVWYKELEHVTGQHVFYKGIIYKFIKDQKSNTNFKKENCKVILEDVILYNDENKILKFQDVTKIGEKFLDYNKLYMRDLHEIAHNREFGEIFFYSGNNLIEVKDDEISVINLTSSDIYSVDKDFLNIENVENLKNGSKVLIGKELYKYSIDKTFDLVIRQNNKLKRWEFMLNPYTKKFLKLSGYSTDDVVYFSVTEKYDPNILYKSITINVQELINNKECYVPFDNNWNPTDCETSVYTTKYFENYGHEVID
jgi:hypothetical protein